MNGLLPWDEVFWDFPICQVSAFSKSPMFPSCHEVTNGNLADESRRRVSFEYVIDLSVWKWLYFAHVKKTWIKTILHQTVLPPVAERHQQQLVAIRLRKVWVSSACRAIKTQNKRCYLNTNVFLRSNCNGWLLGVSYHFTMKATRQLLSS